MSVEIAPVSGKPISPNNVLRRRVWPACQAADVPRVTWLTFRRTYSSWAHDKGVPAKVVAQLMGHTKVDTTMNVYTQVLDGAARLAADRVGSELFRIVQNCSDPGWNDGANSLKRLAPQAGFEPATLRLTVASA
jgi:integrase-like protein